MLPATTSLLISIVLFLCRPVMIVELQFWFVNCYLICKGLDNQISGTRHRHKHHGRQADAWFSYFWLRSEHGLLSSFQAQGKSQIPILSLALCTITVLSIVEHFRLRLVVHSRSTAHLLTDWSTEFMSLMNFRLSLWYPCCRQIWVTWVFPKYKIHKFTHIFTKPLTFLKLWVSL